MDLEIKKAFEEIRADLAEFFSFVRDNVATKDDLRKELERFATKEDLNNLATKLDLELVGIRGELVEIRVELRSIDDRLTRLEMRVAALAKGSTEDIDALADDYITIRRRLEILEEALRKQGIPVPPFQPANHGSIAG